MDTQALIARLRERAATQDACGCWSLDKAAADELERLDGMINALQAEVERQNSVICDYADYVALGGSDV